MDHWRGPLATWLAGCLVGGFVVAYVLVNAARYDVFLVAAVVASVVCSLAQPWRRRSPPDGWRSPRRPRP